MKTLMFVTALMIGASAQAQIQPEAVFGSIFDLIQNQIAQDKGNQGNKWNNNNNSWKNNKVILKDVGSNILLGRVFIDDAGQDAVDFPRCNVSNNQRVDRLRFTVDEADVYIETVRVTFQNGKFQDIVVDQEFSAGDRSAWVRLNGLNDRCIKKIRVRGEVLPSWGGPGYGNGGNWNGPGIGGHIQFGNGNGSISFGPGIGKPGKPPVKFNETAIINFIGRKG